MIDTNHTPYFAYTDVWYDSMSDIRHLACSKQGIRKRGFGSKLLRQLLGPATMSSPNCFGSYRSRQQDCLGGPSCSPAPPQAMVASAASLLGNKAVSTALWLGCNKLQSFLQIFHQVASTKTWSMPLHMTSISLTSWRINIHYNATLVGLILAHSSINSKSGQ